MKKTGRKLGSIYTAMLVIALAVIVLAGCSSSSADPAAVQQLTVEEIGKQIEQSINLSELKQRDLSTLKKWYKIEAENVEAFMLYSSASNVKADELAVIKLKQLDDLDAVKAKIEERLEAQKVKFKDYRPDEYFLVENYMLKTNGPFILLAVSEQAEQIAQAFEEAFKQVE